MWLHPQFVAIAYAATRFTAVLTHIKDISFKRAHGSVTARGISTALSLVFATAYTLGLPTLVAAITGYQASTSAMI